MSDFALSYEERTDTSTYTGEGGVMVVDTILLVVYDRSCGYQKAIEERVIRVDLHFEGMQLERSDAITKFMAVKDYYWAGKLLQGWELDCPVLREALRRLGTAAVIEDGKKTDILSLTKEFIHDHSQQ